MLDIKFPSKFYVGMTKNRYNDTDNQRMLGFATPLDGTAADNQRKETVDRWRDKTIEPLEIENIPTFGYSIVDTVSRYTTDNKLFRILGPGNYELEISAANLFRLICSSTIVNGKIMDPLVWGRVGSKNYLISSTSEEYIQHLAPKKVQPKDVVGHYFEHPANKNIVYRYEGKFHYVSAKITNEYKRSNTYPSYYYRDNSTMDIRLRSGSGSRCLYTINFVTKNKEAFDVYTEFNLGTQTKTIIHLRKSKLKDLIYVGDSYPGVPDFSIPVAEWLESTSVPKAGKAKFQNGSHEYRADVLTILDNTSYRGDHALFRTRNDIEAFILPTADIIKQFVRYIDSYDVVFLDVWKNGVLQESKQIKG